METNVNVISCELKSGIGKASGKPYSFYVGKVYLLGAVVEFTSEDEFKGDISKSVRAKVTLTDFNNSIKCKLSKAV